MKTLKSILIIFLISQNFNYPQELKLYNETNSPLVAKNLTSLAIDSSNSVWVGGSNQQLFKFNKSWNIDTSIGNITERNYINEISVSPNGTIWFGISDYYSCGLYSLNNDSWQYINYEYGIYFIRNIYIDNDSTIYYSLINQWGMGLGDDKIAIFSDDSIRTFDHPFVYNLVPINKDTLLVASAFGVVMFFPDSINLFNEEEINTINPNGWQPTGITKLGEEIFVYGERLSKYAKGTYIEYTKIDSVLSSDTSNITSLVRDRNNFLWIGTDKGKLIKYNKNIEVYDFSNYSIRDIAIDRYNNKWFISDEGCFVFNEDKIVKVEQGLKLPTTYSLSQNYPNPFNPSTKISYSIPKSGSVKISLYDILGREIIKLVDDYKEVGKYEIEFNAGNLSSGIYFYRINSGNYTKTKKMVLLK